MKYTITKVDLTQKVVTVVVQPDDADPTVRYTNNVCGLTKDVQVTEGGKVVIRRGPIDFSVDAEISAAIREFCATGYPARPNKPSALIGREFVL